MKKWRPLKRDRHFLFLLFLRILKVSYARRLPASGQIIVDIVVGRVDENK